MDGPAEDLLTMKTCKQCTKARYCSVVCQKAHWQAHKAVCKATAAQE